MNIIGLSGITLSIVFVAVGASWGSVPGTVWVICGLGVMGFSGSMWNVGLATLVTESAESSVLGRISMNVRTLTAIVGIVGAVMDGLLSEVLGITALLWAAVLVCAAGALSMAYSVAGATSGRPAQDEGGVKAAADA
jgi:hypothetical protein